MIPSLAPEHDAFGSTTGAALAPSKMATPRQPPFSQAELEAFRASDQHAAMAIVGILTTIFTLGLMGYATIAFPASRGP